MWSYGNFNEAFAVQTGKQGTIKIIQKQDELGTAPTAAKGNLVMISQDGNNSEADIMQDGLENTVEGLGGAGSYAINNNGAYLKVRQTGELNLVQSRQIVGASATINQMGANNTSIVNQY
jgi:hypothetical protein